VAQLDIDGAAYTYGYDSRGHTTTDGRRTYLWNEAEQISGITGMSDYSYDGHGKRVKTVLAGGSVEYSIYNLAGQLMHTEKDGVKTDFLSLNGKPLAEIRTAGSATSTKYLHPDISGSPRLATDASGVLLWRESYTPYGEKLNATEGKTGYTGHAYDAESGLVYMQARYYDPQLARFLSTDPVGFDPGNTFSFSRYAYANNNPYRYIDPDGRDNVAVVTGSRLSTSNDISHWRGQYTIHEYSVYRTPNGTPAWAANLVGRVLGDKVGSFEVSWNARSSDARNRGTVLGDSSKIAEVSLGEGRHPIQVTDIGRAKEDVLTQVTNGETIMRTQIRLHSGGPYFSLGCGVTCDTKSKLTTESNLISNMPALGNLGETTYISLPAKED
jgi:RHS repeat-associated protein